MKISLKKTIAALSLFCTLTAYSQNNKELNVGDYIPDTQLKEIINFSKSTVNTAEYKNKLLIIDFWTTTCTPCIASFPKLEELQQKFSDQIQILQATYEDADKVNSLYEKLKKVNKKTRPSIVNDRILRTYFPSTTVPHVVWIKNNKVVSITSGEELTERNISGMLKDEILNLPQKRDSKRTLSYFLDESNSAFNLNVTEVSEEGLNTVSIDPKEIVIQAIVTRFTNGFPKVSQCNTTTAQATNLTIKQLYALALWKFGDESFNSNKTVVEVSDTNLFNIITPEGPNGKSRPSIDDIWIKNNKYCVEIKVPEEMSEYKFDIMLSALNNYLGNLYGIEGVIEKRKTKTLALIQINKEEKFKTKGGKRSDLFDIYSVSLQNTPISTFIKALRVPLQLAPPIIDETNYTQNVDMNFTCKLSDVAELNKELEKIGLKLVEKEAVTDIAIIRKKGTSLNNSISSNNSHK